MRRARLYIAILAGLSLLLNAVLVGIAVRLWSRTDGGTASAVFFSLPMEVRQELRGALSDSNGRLRAAQAQVQEAREVLQMLLSQDRPDPTALQRAMSDVRTATERLQIELHAIIFRHYSL